MKNKLTKWIGTDFVSSSEQTGEFDSFVKDFKAELTNQLKETGIIISNCNKGHFYISGFLHKSGTVNFVYFSIPDVRGVNDQWNTSVLVRKARDLKDFSGGQNYYVAFNSIFLLAGELLRNGGGVK